MEVLDRAARLPGMQLGSGKNRKVGMDAIAAGNLDRHFWRTGTTRIELDGSRKGVRPIEVRHSPARKFQAFQRRDGNAIPLYPSTKRVIQGDSIAQNHGPTRSAAA